MPSLPAYLQGPMVQLAKLSGTDPRNNNLVLYSTSRLGNRDLVWHIINAALAKVNPAPPRPPLISPKMNPPVRKFNCTFQIHHAQEKVDKGGFFFEGGVSRTSLPGHRAGS